MTAELLAILLAAILGTLIARAIDPRASGALLAGEALLFGLGACGGILFVLAIAHVPWSRVTFAVAYVVLCAACWVLHRVAQVSAQHAARSTQHRLTSQAARS